jgi:hypothetical protein
VITYREAVATSSAGVAAAATLGVDFFHTPIPNVAAAATLGWRS